MVTVGGHRTDISSREKVYFPQAGLMRPPYSLLNRWEKLKELLG